MQSLQDLQDKLFFECKSILENVSKINTPEELLVKHDILIELTDRINFMKYLDKNKEVFASIAVEEPQSSISEISVTEADHEEFIDNDGVEEEVLFTNELNDFDENEFENNIVNESEVEIPEDVEDQFVNDIVEDEIEIEDDFDEEEELINVTHEEEIPEVVEDQLVDDIIDEEIILHHHDLEVEEDVDVEILNHVEDNVDDISVEIIEETVEEIQIPEFEKPKEVDDMFAFAMDNSDKSNSEISAQQVEKLEEVSPIIVQEVASEVEIVTPTQEFKTEIKIEEPIQEPTEEKISLQEKAEQTSDKKFKLSNIKGMKAIHSLFDDEMFDAPVQAAPITATPSTTHSKNDFKLDLNDKIAFTKTLFGGSQTDLNDAMRIINDCGNLEEAKEYLSDLYYDRNWSKVDDYAQRLWTLVENKFG